ncbi:MAG TPA: hypothetical protein VFH38_00445 [Jatrophihabitans sp.]|nr:hypothetical protein [Jatrophihabitans sp.]
MGTLQRQHSRAERTRDYTAALDLARGQVAAMGALVLAREARPTTAGKPLELQFAATEVDGRALPAAVWVALRRGSVDAALDAMCAVSTTHFLIEEREEIGAGYRLQTVEETRPLPEVDLLLAQLAAMLDIPVDVLAVLADWGGEDPRLEAEIDELLASRFGPATRASQPPPPLAAMADAATERPQELGRLEMTVAQAAAVLRLDQDQARTLATLVDCAVVTLTS